MNRKSTTLPLDHKVYSSILKKQTDINKYSLTQNNSVDEIFIADIKFPSRRLLTRSLKVSE